MFHAKTMYGGVYLSQGLDGKVPQLEDLVIKYLGIPKEDQQAKRVKIKVRKGKIIIEKIGE